MRCPSIDSHSHVHSHTRGYRHVGVDSFVIGSIGVKLECVPLLPVVLEFRLFAVTLTFRFCVIFSKPIQIAEIDIADIDRFSQARAGGRRPSTARKAINCEVTKP
jgi:hypothetical protein